MNWRLIRVNLNYIPINKAADLANAEKSMWIGLYGSHGLRRLFGDALEHFLLRSPVKGQLSFQHLIQHNPKGKPINRLIVIQTFDDLVANIPCQILKDIVLLLQLRILYHYCNKKYYLNIAIKNIVLFLCKLEWTVPTSGAK